MTAIAEPDVKELFKTARDEGALSAESAQALDVIDIGAQIQAALGTPVNEIQASEVVLVTLLIDDSGSIRFSGNSQAVRDGHNLILDSLASSKQTDGIQAHCRYLNGTILYPYRSLDQATRMDTHNYDPNGGTPLYDQIAVVLGTVLAKTQEFSKNGVPVRSVTAFITDGRDEHSVNQSAKSIAPLVRDLLMSEQHIIAAMGIDDKSTDFRTIFRDIGIEDRWILTPANNASEIRKAFAVLSQSAVRVSQNAQSFSQAAIGGFGA